MNVAKNADKRGFAIGENRKMHNPLFISLPFYRVVFCCLAHTHHLDTIRSDKTNRFRSLYNECLSNKLPVSFSCVVF